ncbi:GDP-mannose 4,6-dehydratase [Bradyrhizobium sp. UFLA05-112]
MNERSRKVIVRIDPTYLRPTEVDLPIGDPSKAHDKLGWKSRAPFAQLVKQMVAGDLPEARREIANGKHSV